MRLSLIAVLALAAAPLVRAEGIANDLADGQTPEQVRKFRASLRTTAAKGSRLYKLYGRDFWMP